MLLNDFFGNSNPTDLDMRDLTLASNPGKKLSKKKLKSHAKKYFSIPPAFLNYYPRYN